MMTTIDRQIEALEKEAEAFMERIADTGREIEKLDSDGYELPRRIHKIQLLNGAFFSVWEAEKALHKAKWID